MAFLVLVADAHSARFYLLANRAGRLREIRTLDNPAAHARDSDLSSGPAGRVLNRVAGARHTYQPRRTFKEKATADFVRTVSGELADLGRERPLADLVLVAAPRMLGRYRKLAPAGLRSRVVLEIPLDLAGKPVPELNRLVTTALRDVPVRRRRAVPEPD